MTIKLNTNYFYSIYTNPRTGVKYIIYRGIGYVENGKAIIDKSKIWGKDAFGHEFLNNPFDLKSKYGELPCLLITTNDEVLAFDTYKDIKEISKKFNIKVSNNMCKPHTHKAEKKKLDLEKEFDIDFDTVDNSSTNNEDDEYSTIVSFKKASFKLTA